MEKKSADICPFSVLPTSAKQFLFLIKSAKKSPCRQVADCRLSAACRHVGKKKPHVGT
jgi:hypothetical protein